MSGPGRPIMTAHPKTVSARARREVGLSDPDLWLRYFELGGMGTAAEMESYLRRAVTPSAHENDVLDQAMDEQDAAFGHNHPLAAERSPMSDPASRSLAAEKIQLTLLGSFSLRTNEQHVRVPMNAQRLISFLALNDGSLLRQHVAGSLWSDTSERHAGGSLRSALWRLGHLTFPLVEVADPHLRLSPGVAVDFRASESLARRLLDDSQDLSEADMDAALLSAELLPDWTEDWILIMREYHTQLRLRALEALCRRLSAMGRFGQAVQAGILAVSGEPLRESGQRTLISAHLAEGNVGAAIKQYDSFCELLRDELGLKPSADLKTLLKGAKSVTLA